MTASNVLPTFRTRMALQISVICTFALSAAPLLAWYARRVTDQSDEPLGVIALVTAIGFLTVMLRGKSAWSSVKVHPARMLSGAVLLGVIQTTGLAHFPLLLGLLAVATVAFSITMPRGKAGFIALLVLSLPLVASLDFYAGYPLRLAAAELSVWLLRLTGLAVARAGVILLDGDNLVGMDPPCAGVRMLWTACFTAAVVAMRMRLAWSRTLMLLGGAVICVILGNSLRAALVFFPESGRVHWPEWMHPGIGLVVHGGVLAAVFGLGSVMEGMRRRATTFMPGKLCTLLGCIGVAAALIAAQFLGNPSSAPAFAVSWPATLDGTPLTPIPLSTRESRFAQAFPGGIAKFRCGASEVILRRVEQCTRRMHPSADCLRAAGFTITTKPVHQDADGRVWGCCLAERGGQTWRVRERFVNAAQTRVCTDASAWFWGAMLHPDEGPWTAVTVLEPHDDLPATPANVAAATAR